MRRYPVTVFYLELNFSEWSGFNVVCDPKITFRKIGYDETILARDLYWSVGREWYWADRHDWSLSQWKDRIYKLNVSLWVMYKDNEPAGYYELELQQNDDVEVSYFGLLPGAVGQGFGKYMLVDAFRRSFNDLEASRIWLHTCTLDHPRALSNYQSRGMRIYKKESDIQYIPDGWDLPTH